MDLIVLFLFALLLVLLPIGAWILTTLFRGKPLKVGCGSMGEKQGGGREPADHPKCESCTCGRPS